MAEENDMKKFIKVLAVLTVLTIAVAALFACAPDGEVTGDKMTLVLTDGGDYTQVFEVD